MNIKAISRSMGIFWMITSIIWAGIGIAGLFYGLNWLDNLETSLDANIDLVIDSMDSVHGLVVETSDVISATNQTLATTQLAVQDLSTSLEDLRPILWKTQKVTTIDVPDALDGVQESMPSLIETAKSVDETLTWLSSFQFTIPNPFGTDWSYDLGISYAPEVPLNQALENMSGNLEEIPDDLRGMKDSLTTADSNLITVSDDLTQMVTDLSLINAQIAEVNPQLDAIADNLQTIGDSFSELQTKFPDSIATARKILMALMSFIAISQIPFVYTGWLFASGTIFDGPHPPKDEKS